jgi:hypothetical protein
MALAPRLWLQGAALTTTGGSGSSKQAAICAALTAMLRCRPMTALGRPVEPEVSSSLAVSSGRAVKAVGAEASRSVNAMSVGRALALATTGRPLRKSASSAPANAVASSA